jgi:hypothetical protein
MMSIAFRMTNTQLLPYEDPGPLILPAHLQFQQPPSVPFESFLPNAIPSPHLSSLLHLRRRPSITGWYAPSPSPTSSADSSILPASAAYETALSYITTELPLSDRDAILASRKNTVRDVQIAVLEAQKTYEVKTSKNKVQKWLRRLSARVMYYGGILDVLSQHHPEYVSLAWGAMKFVFIVSTSPHFTEIELELDAVQEHSFNGSGSLGVD